MKKEVLSITEERELAKLAKFYFFAVLDDYFALELAHQANRILQKKYNKNNTNKPREQLFVEVTFQVWERYRRRIVKGQPQFAPDKYFLLDTIDFSHWIAFQKKSTDDELLTIIWIKLLHISENTIESALGISKGTLRYRLGESLKKLGIKWVPDIDL